MNRFLAVVVHEYKKVVLKWSFLVGTLLLPVLAGVFAFVPAIIFSLKGEPTRIALIDRSGTVAPRLKDNLSADKMAERARKAAADAAVDITPSQDEQLKRTSAQLVESFIFTDVDPAGRSLEEIRSDLTSRITADEFDAYLIIPPDVNDTAAVYEFRSRKGADFITNDSLRDALNSAVRSQRLAEANISEERLAAIGKPVVMDAKGLDDRGGEKDTTGLMIASFVIGLMIYITLAIYGQAIMGAVVEEKETRISEILFSSARPFTLLFGKLVGVGLRVDPARDLDRERRRFARLSCVADGSIAARRRGAGDIAADDLLLPHLLSYWLFYLCVDLCTDRFGRHIASGRRPVRLSAGDAFARRVLFQPRGHPRPELDALILGLDRTVLCTDNNADPHHGRNAAFLADRTFDRHQCARDSRARLACLARLSRRDADVR